jgi:hypothetical protein
MSLQVASSTAGSSTSAAQARTASAARRSPTPAPDDREKTVVIPDTPQAQLHDTMECEEEMPTMVTCHFLRRCADGRTPDGRALQSALKREIAQEFEEANDGSCKKSKTQSVFGDEPQSPRELYPMQMFSKLYPYNWDVRLIIRVRPPDDEEVSRLVERTGSFASAEGEPRPKTPTPSSDDDYSKHKVLVMDTRSGKFVPPACAAPTPSSKETDVMVNPYCDPKVLKDFKAPRRTRVFEMDLPDRMEVDIQGQNGPKERAALALVESEVLQPSAKVDPMPVWIKHVLSAIDRVSKLETEGALMRHRLTTMTEMDKILDTMRAYGIDKPERMCSSGDEAMDEVFNPYSFKNRYHGVLGVLTRHAIMQCRDAYQGLWQFKLARTDFAKGALTSEEFEARMDEIFASISASSKGKLQTRASRQMPIEWKADRIEHELMMYANGTVQTMGTSVRETTVVMRTGVCMDLATLWAVEKDASLYQYYSVDYRTLKQMYLMHCAELQATEVRLIEIGMDKQFGGNPPTSAEASAAIKEILYDPFSPSPPMPVSPSLAVPSQPSASQAEEKKAGSQEEDQAPGSQGAQSVTVLSQASGSGACLDKSGSEVEQALKDIMACSTGSSKRVKKCYIVQQLEDMLTAYDDLTKPGDTYDDIMEAHESLSKDINAIKCALLTNGMAADELAVLGRMPESLDADFISSHFEKCDYATLLESTKRILEQARADDEAYNVFKVMFDKFMGGDMTEQEFTVVLQETLLAASCDPHMYDRITGMGDRADIMIELMYKKKIEAEGAAARAVKKKPTLCFRGYNMTWETFHRVKPGTFEARSNNYVSYTYQDLKLEFFVKLSELQAFELRLAELAQAERK